MNLTQRLLATVLTIGGVLVLGTGVQADTPGVGGPYGEYWMEYTGPETLTLLVVPDGSGETFDQAFLPYGGRADATITLVLRDGNGDPIPNFPREDVWLISEDDGLVACVGGAIPDTDTDQQGMTRWSAPLRAGGHSEGRADVRVNGAPIELSAPVLLGFNSPDINGDLVVNLSDVQLFTVDFYYADTFRSDFYRDGVVNLSDLAALSHAFGAACP